MNLFALTDVPGSRLLRLVLTQQLQADLDTLFEEQVANFLDEADVYEFDAHFSPSEGELFFIDNFEDEHGLAAAVANPLGIQQYDPGQHHLADFKALLGAVSHDGDTKIAIQLFEKRRLLSASKFAIFLSQNTFRRANDEGLTLDRKLVAVLDGTTLFFQSFHQCRRVFDLNAYFADATDDEVRQFATSDLFVSDDLDKFMADISPLTRKKIALISKSGTLENMDVEKIVAAAEGFPVTINQKDGKILLPSNRTELRDLLTFLDEDYYESAISKQMFVSTSRRKA